MRIIYDPEANAAYIYLVDEIGFGGAAKSVPIEGEGIHPFDFVLTSTGTASSSGSKFLRRPNS